MIEFSGTIEERNGEVFLKITEADLTDASELEIELLEEDILPLADDVVDIDGNLLFKW